MKVNEMIHGFQIIRVRKSEELNATLYEMKHMKTGAQLVWLDNKDENMLFSATFKTLPWDNTGVFHILEHSVLAGSDKYTVKEPFLDMLKSSMNTFLNAMTFPDKTMYPVSSKNEKDFMNLTRVYLDAVFHPAIYHNDSIFRQEGWHYEQDEKTDAFYYNGVVFNEMKGVFSSVDAVLENEIFKLLFPDNTYRFESGGIPEFIPDLTYENFIEAHRAFYAPSNAKIYLDGSVPIDKVLKIIDEEYLCDFEFVDKKHEINLQKPIQSCKSKQYYEIGKQEDEKQKTYIAFGKVFASWDERKRITAYELITSYLAGTNESPLKRAIMEKGLAQDVEFLVQGGIAQAMLMLVFKNTEAACADEIIDVYNRTIHKILTDGIDKDELTACLNQYAFSLKELEEPQGLTRNIKAMNAWLYDGDPMMYLESNALLEELRQAIDTDYFDEILKELLDTKGIVQLTLLPSKTKGDEDRAKEQQRVDNESASWSDEQLKEVLQTTQRMQNWQDTPDSPEAIATLPQLSLSDVNPKPQWTDTVCEDVNGIKVLYHPVDSNGVVHCNMYFSMADADEEQLTLMSVMTDLLGVLPTEKHTSAELQKLIKKNFGLLDFSVGAVAVKEHFQRCKPYLNVFFSVLENNMAEAIDIVCEILCSTDFSDSTIIKENLLQSCDNLYQSIMTSGHMYALRRVLSKTSATAYVQEKAQGYDVYRFVKELCDNFDSEIDHFKKDVKVLADRFFVSSRLTLSETSNNKHADLSNIIDKLAKGENSKKEFFEMVPVEDAVKEAILIPSGVSYASSGANLNKYNSAFNGRLTVISNILTYGYLWNEIRVHGGAYGCGFRADANSNVVFHSYRDPDPLNSVHVYKETSRFIKDFVNSDENIEKYIISSIAGIEGLISSAKKGIQADINWLSGITYEDKQETYNQILSMKKEDMLDFCDLFDKMAQGNSICIVGNSDSLSNLDKSWKIYQL